MIIIYTILVTQENELVTSVQETIMQRSKLVDRLHFLVDQIYKDLEMSDFTVILEYLLPVSKKYKSEVLILSEELYKDRLEYILPFDTDLTSEPGDIELQLTFTKIEVDPDGGNKQYVRKTQSHMLTITPISAWSDIIPDDALNAIDQKMLQLDSKLQALGTLAEAFDQSKADNIKLDTDTQELYLTSKGEAIGDKVSLNDLGDAIADNTTDGLITVII